MIQQTLRLLPTLGQREKKKSIKQQLLEVLIDTDRWLVSHEFWQYGVESNDHCANARLNELRLAGKVKSRRRENSNFVEFHRV